MVIKRGDIFYADLRPVVGSEQGGIRPVLIIQNDTGNKHSPTVICAAITSRMNKAKLPTHVELVSSKYNIDKEKVEVIYNFITNAINYSGDSKEIIIKEEVINNSIRISVQDFGIGIDEDEQHLIWNRYYRVDKTHQRHSVGTGLGLSIVKEILEHYKFNYGLISEKGKGSTFYFEIPLEINK